MNRCVPGPALLALGLAFSALAASGQTLQRPFPAHAFRGELVVMQPPTAVLNGSSVKLAPGSRIRNADNLLVLSGTLAGQRLLVHYTLDASGLLQDAWILSAAEAARQPWPRNAQEAAALRYDPATQTWSRP
ncbi:MAG: hypothetical protein ACOVOT_10070 [Rubrivivax sp.]|jgi:hypothetical protein|nr:hypothetical protein [Rubrivivax sp.]